MEHPAMIKVHQPSRTGVLVELAGEFDLACLDALKQALRRARNLGTPAFVDLAGVTFMDALCLRELASPNGGRRLALCRPSEEFMLGVAACGLEESIEVVPDDDPGYEDVIAEACRCSRSRRTVRSGEHHLYLRTSQQTSSLPYTEREAAGTRLRRPVAELPARPSTGVQERDRGAERSGRAERIDGVEGRRRRSLARLRPIPSRREVWVGGRHGLAWETLSR